MGMFDIEYIATVKIGPITWIFTAKVNKPNEVFVHYTHKGNSIFKATTVNAFIQMVVEGIMPGKRLTKCIGHDAGSFSRIIYQKNELRKLGHRIKKIRQLLAVYYL